MNNKSDLGTFRSSFKKSKLSLLMLASIGCGLTSLPAFSAGVEFAPGRILMKPAQGVSEKELTRLLQSHDANQRAIINAINVRIINVPVGAEEALARALSHNPKIEFAEIDQLNKLDEIIPNDTYFNASWHLPKVNAPSAWETSTGKSVVVAVLDTGVDSNHPDLIGKVLQGINTVDNTTNTADIAGHGTNVAGVIGAASNNGQGVSSIAWDSQILPVRVSNQSSGSAYTSDLAEGVTWAANNGAHIVNASYALTSSSSVNSAAAYLKEKGGIMVVSAGNDGSQWSFGDSSNLISVSATSSSDQKTSWSSYGSFVDVSAPGAGIYTTSNGGGYASVSGTSFSAPLTAGILGLIKAANWNLTPDQMENILESSAVDLGSAGFDINFGHGRVDAHAAVLLAQQTTGGIDNTPAPDTTPPSINFDLANTQLSGVASINVSATDNTSVKTLTLSLGSAAGEQLLSSVNGDQISIGLDTIQLYDGAYTLSATAADSYGNTSTSDIEITIANNIATDSTPPTVYIKNLYNDAVVLSNMKVTVEASDDIALSMIYCYINGALVASSNISPLSCPINTKKLKNGNHVFSAEAADLAGNTDSSTINFTIGLSSSGGGEKNPKGGGKGRK